MREVLKRLPVVVATKYSDAILEGIAAGEAHVARVALATKTLAGACEAARLLSESARALAAISEAREPPPAPIACAKGCSYCCHAKVVVTAPEALRIASLLRERLSAEAFDAVLDRVRAVDDETRGLTRVERAAKRLPCPLLEDDACSVHDIRPLVCAGWNSLDVEACATSYETPEAPSAPVHAPSHALATAILGGLAKACFEEGLDGTPLEFIAALRIALERPNAAARWFAKLPVFSQAHDAEWAPKRVEHDPDQELPSSR